MASTSLTRLANRVQADWIRRVNAMSAEELLVFIEREEKCLINPTKGRVGEVLAHAYARLDFLTR